MSLLPQQLPNGSLCGLADGAVDGTGKLGSGPASRPGHLVSQDVVSKAEQTILVHRIVPQVDLLKAGLFNFQPASEHLIESALPLMRKSLQKS